MTTVAEISNQAAEAVFRRIEDTKRINKAEIADAIESVLLRHQPAATYACLERPALVRLVQQVYIGDYRDGLGHDLKHNVAYLNALEPCGND